MDKLPIYNQIRDEISSCQKCDLGCNGPLDGQDPHVVGQGNLDAKIMFIAEAPGEQETIHRKPLTPPGVSGKLYEQVLDYLGLTRDQVYTTNTVACRPPGNRDPELWELNKCRDYLNRQIQLVQPKLVITFGRFAAQVFLNNVKITKDHGKLQKSASFNVDVFPLVHPAYVQAYAPLKQREAFKQDIKVLKGIVKGLMKEDECA